RCPPEILASFNVDTLLAAARGAGTEQEAIAAVAAAFPRLALRPSDVRRIRYGSIAPEELYGWFGVFPPDGEAP
ncbi:MAG TPA: hypothetical protein VGM39_08030, partial [Kofleriaceae bacterium]